MTSVPPEAIDATTSDAVKLLPCGERAILVELKDAPARRKFDDHLRAHPIKGIAEQIPAAQTVLVRLTGAEVRAEVARALREIDLSNEGVSEGTTRSIEIPVTYDGEDLEDVARIVGLSVDEVITRHTSQVWTVDFTGFMPGFGYLTGTEGGLTVPRRESPRAKIPAGSIALAGDFTGLYPQASPGGWQLIGRTDTTLWDLNRPEPALLTPGLRVRFVAVNR